MVDGESCAAQSDRLNCGCCDAVYLECDLEAHNDGLHEMTVQENGRTYRVYWEEQHA